MRLKILTVGNPKLQKGEKQRVLTAVLHLAAGAADICPYATASCKALCLMTAGRGGIPQKRADGYINSIEAARARRTDLYRQDLPELLRLVQRDIERLKRESKRRRFKLAVRLNGTSDIRWEKVAPQIFTDNPDVTFYDYTKFPVNARQNLPSNYSLTYSWSERMNGDKAREIIERRENVAVVFDTPKGRQLPATFHGVTVVDGDVTDLRFRDPRGVVVGLRAKGRARKAAPGNGFVMAA